MVFTSARGGCDGGAGHDWGHTRFFERASRHYGSCAGTNWRASVRCSLVGWRLLRNHLSQRASGVYHPSSPCRRHRRPTPPAQRIIRATATGSTRSRGHSNRGGNGEDDGIERRAHPTRPPQPRAQGLRQPGRATPRGSGAGSHIALRRGVARPQHLRATIHPRAHAIVQSATRTRPSALLSARAARGLELQSSGRDARASVSTFALRWHLVRWYVRAYGQAGRARDLEPSPRSCSHSRQWEHLGEVREITR